MRLAVALLLTACSARPATKPQPLHHTTADNTCGRVAWSCVTASGGEASRCVEGNAAERAKFEASCAQGQFTLGPCLRDHVVGGCTVAREDACTTTWHHAASHGSIESDCAAHGALFAAP